MRWFVGFVCCGLFWRFVWACFDWMIVDRFLLLLLWLINMIVYCDWLFIVKEFWLRDCVDWLSWLLSRLIDMIVDFGSFWLNGCDFVRKKKNYGWTVHCDVAVVKSYVKMSAADYRRLFIFRCGRVLFVVKTLSCSERRFANETSPNRLTNRNRYFFCAEQAAICLVLFLKCGFRSANGKCEMFGAKILFSK